MTAPQRPAANSDARKRAEGKATHAPDPTIRVYRKEPLETPPTYIGYCCREWILAALTPVGSCGICGELPTYLREDGGR